MTTSPPTTGFKPIKRRTFEDVALQVREQIASGSLREGDKLPSERALSETLGVSRNTVREALRSLEYAGVVIQKPGVSGGAYVSNGGAGVIRSAFDDLLSMGTITAADLIEARIVIGREVARLACARYNDADFALLEENVTLTRQAALAGDLPLRVRYSLEFHNLMAKAAKNLVLSIMTGVLTDMTMKFVKVLGEMPNDFVVESRLRMLDHLRQRNVAMAADEADGYLRTTLHSYMRGAQLPASDVTPGRD